MADDGFDFEDGMNVVTDEFDEYWWENLGKWKADERLVLDTIENLNTEPYDHSIDTIDPDEPTDLPGLVTDEEVDWLVSKVELSLGI